MQIPTSHKTLSPNPLKLFPLYYNSGLSFCPSLNGSFEILNTRLEDLIHSPGCKSFIKKQKRNEFYIQIAAIFRTGYKRSHFTRINKSNQFVAST